MLLFSITLVFVGALASVFLRTTFPQIFSDESSTPTKTEMQPTIASDRWDFYRDESNKFSLPYPKGLTVEKSTYGVGVNSIELQDRTGTVKYRILIFPKRLGALIGQDFAAYKAMAPQTATVISEVNAQEAQRFVKIRDRLVGQYEAIDFLSTASPPEPNEIPEVGTYIEVGENVVVISTAEENKETLEAMLTDFRSL